MESQSHSKNWDFSQIDDYIFLGADLCCGNDHYEFLVKEMGIRADIDVQSERLNPPSPMLEHFLWLPTKDMLAPSRSQLMVGANMIDELVKEKKRMFIHCLNGHGRSPTVLAAYYVLKQGMTPEAAVKKIQAARPEVHPNEAQMASLTELIK